MADYHSYIPLDSIITDYLDESEQAINKYSKCFHIAFRGMDDLGIDFFYQIQTVKLPPNANLTVSLPANCLNVIKAGVLNSRGEIVPLNSNSKLTTYADLLPNRISKVEDNSIFDWSSQVNSGFFYNYWNNGSYTNMYGLPSGAPFVGSYKYDSVNNLLVLNTEYQFDYVMVECLVSPLEGSDYHIPVQFREALIAWLWMKDKKAINIKRGAVGINRDLVAEYSKQRKIAQARYNPFKIEEAYQSSLEQTRMAIKG